MRNLLLGVALASLLQISPAQALQEPRPLATDPRLKVIPYSPNDVFKFTGHYGYQSSIEFASDESIVTISIGDSQAWQIVPNQNRIFLKPVEQDADTNMTVITDRRNYNFELHAKKTDSVTDKNLTFVFKFIYPENEGGEGGEIIPQVSSEPDVENNPRAFNMKYSISGSESIAPVRIFDDGEFTYFQFRDRNATIPAFFMVDSEGKEAVVNYRKTRNYVVVERVVGQFTLRDGQDIVCVFNDAAPLRKVTQ